MSKLKATRARTALSLSLGESGAPPSEFRIFALGVNESEKGSFMVDEAALASVMAEYERHGKALLFDFNHAVTFSQPTPEQAVSAGEFTPEARADGLWATAIKWTERAAALIAAKEYRFFSPLFEHDPKTRRVLRLINVALTNLPALDNIEPLVAASATPNGEGTMNELEKALADIAELKKAIAAKDAQIKALEGQTATVALSAVVGLGATAGDTEVRTAVAGVVGFRRQVLEVIGAKDETTALGALTALKQTETEARELRAKVAEIEATALAADFKGFLDGLSTTGKDGKFLTPARRQVVEDLAVKVIGAGTLTPKGVEAGKVAALGMLEGRTAGTFTPVAGGLGISNEQGTILSKMNIDPSKFSEFQAKQLAGGGR